MMTDGKTLTNEERARIAEAAAGVKEIFKDQRKVSTLRLMSRRTRSERGESLNVES